VAIDAVFPVDVEYYDDGADIETEGVRRHRDVGRHLTKRQRPMQSGAST
jgi:hypothetical protein